MNIRRPHGQSRLARDRSKWCETPELKNRRRRGRSSLPIWAHGHRPDLVNAPDTRRRTRRLPCHTVRCRCDVSAHPCTGLVRRPEKRYRARTGRRAAGERAFCTSTRRTVTAAASRSSGSCDSGRGRFKPSDGRTVRMRHHPQTRMEAIAR